MNGAQSIARIVVAILWIFAAAFLVEHYDLNPRKIYAHQDHGENK